MSEAQTSLATRQARRMDMNTTDMRTLRLLDEHGPLGLSEIGQHLDLRPASVTSLIDRLEAAQLIERVREGTDRRKVTVRARPEAVRLSFDVWAPVLQAMDAVGHALSERDQQVVCAYLDCLTDLMRSHTSD